MKSKIKRYFENLDPRNLRLKGIIKVRSISKLGTGASNLNYLVETNRGKFIFRMNMNPKNKDKSKKEFEALKIIENKNIGPKAFVLDKSRRVFDSDFIIISYIDGVLCSRIKPYFDKNMIKNLARLLAKVHSIKITPELNTKLPHYSVTPLDELKHFKNYRDYLVKKIENKNFIGMIDSSFNKLKERLKNFKTKSKLVLSQGDFHKGNIIVNRRKYSLIDFEDLEITSQASSLSHLFIDFKHAGFTKKQQEIFLKEYRKHVSLSKNIREEIEKFTPVKALNIFLWSAEFSLKVRDKEMHSSFSKQSNNEKNINYAILCFKQAIKLGAIDKKHKNFNLRGVLK